MTAPDAAVQIMADAVPYACGSVHAALLQDAANALQAAGRLCEPGEVERLRAELDVVGSRGVELATELVQCRARVAELEAAAAETEDEEEATGFADTDRPFRRHDTPFRPHNIRGVDWMD